MDKKIICVIANGYAEEMMAAVLMDAIRAELTKKHKQDETLLVGGSLVSSGRWYQDKRFATFFSGGMSPSGGFPTRSWKGFFSDLFSGVFGGPLKLADFVKGWAENNLELVIVVGDFLLLATAIPALKKKHVPCVFIPTAKSDHIQPHFKIEKKYILKYASQSFPRDEITAQNFREFGIHAEYLGNLMQDLLDPAAVALTAEEPIVAVLPGSREESYGNLGKILTVVGQIGRPIHWAFVQAAALDPQKVEETFLAKRWRKQSASPGVGQKTAQGQDILDGLYPKASWTNGTQTIYIYPGSSFDNVALGCCMGISLAGTVGDQIAGLGKPILSFLGTGPQTSKMRMKEYEKLLGEAFVYEKSYPSGVVNTLNHMLADEEWRKKLGAEGLKRMGQAGGAAKIAKKISDLYL